MNYENELFSSVCLIQCGTESGNGLQVATDLVLTADHVVVQAITENKSITAMFENEDESIECKVISPLDGSISPVALLKLSKKRKQGYYCVSDDVLMQDSTVRAHGFPSTNAEVADSISLTCVRVFDELRDTGVNVSFNPNKEKRASFNGFSGSPIIYNGHVIGMLISQGMMDNTANRLFGICGLPYRTLLNKLGIQLPIVNALADNQNAGTASLMACKQVEMACFSEMDLLLGELFEPIESDREKGLTLKSREDLIAFLERLPNRKCSDLLKADFYYKGANWLLQDRLFDEAEKYYKEAIRINPDLDDSVYRAYLLLKERDTVNAKAILKPINSKERVSAYLDCLAAEKASTNSAVAVLEASGVEPTKVLYRQIAQIALQAGDYPEGHKYVKLAANGTKDAELMLLDALIHYWCAMDRVYPNADRHGFTYIPNYRYIPDPRQVNELQATHDILAEVFEMDAIAASDKLRAKVSWAMLMVGYLLPGVDCELWLSNFRKYSPLDPADIIFCISNRIPIPEKMCTEFLDRDISDEDSNVFAFAKAELLIYKGEIEQAKAFFREKKDQIAEYSGLCPEECELLFLIDCKEYSAAEKVISRISISKEKKMRYSIGIRFSKGLKTFNPLVKDALALASLTNEDLDYRNAAVVCRKYKKWKDLIKLGKEWWKKTNHLAALSCVIEGYYAREDFTNCLKVISQAESNGDHSSEIVQYKLNALIGATQFEEARKLADTFPNRTRNAKLTVLYANTFVSQGRRDEAIRTLKSFADQDLYDYEVYKMLIEMIQGDNPDLAYQYALLLSEHEPGNEQIAKYAGMVALMTGHDHSTLSHNFTTLLQKDASKDGPVRIAEFDEILELIKAGHEQEERNNSFYGKGDAAMHLICEANTPMAGEMWSRMEGGRPYLGRFGYSKGIRIDYERPLLLDYTTCFVLCKLGLVDRVCSVFREVWVDSHLFEVWISDITNLKNVQTSVLKRDKSLFEAINRVKYTTISTRDYTNDPAYAQHDYLIAQCAKDNQAFIIEDHPSADISGQAVPEEWHEWHIHPDVFYAAMEKLQLPHPKCDCSKIDPEQVSKITPHCGLILSDEVLNKLVDSSAIDYVSSIFNLFMPDFQVDGIRGGANIHNNRQSAITMSEDYCKQISDKHINKAICLKRSPVGKDRHENPYVKLLQDEMECAMSTAVTFLVDDRFCTSYLHIGKKSVMLSSYDLISQLHQDGLIGTSIYWSCIDRLLSFGYSYFVPPSDYIASRLLMAQVDAEGYLQEYDQLYWIRRSVAYALNPEFGVRREKKSHQPQAEYAGYFTELYDAFHDALISIWKSDKDYDWCCAASDWLLSSIVYLPSDVKTSEQSALKQNAIRLIGDAISIQHGRRRGYLRWVEPHFVGVCLNNEAWIKEISERFLSGIDKVLTSEEIKMKSAENWAKLNLFEFAVSLPKVLLSEMIKDPRFALYASSVPWITPYVKTCITNSSTGIDSPCDLNIRGILTADQDALRKATEFILHDQEKNTKEFVSQFDVQLVEQISREANNKLAQYFAELSYYFPVSKRGHLTALRCALALYRK